MPQFYKRKTNRATKTRENVMQRAAHEVTSGKSLRSVAADFDIDKMTLHRFIKKRQENPEVVTGYAAVANAHSVFPKEMETDLAKHVKMLSDMFFGLSLEKCCVLAYEFALKNELQMPASWDENKRAGKSWWLGFKQRNNLAIRSPEATSLARASAFNRHTVKEFFDNLACVMDKHKFNPEDIYDLNETGCTTSQNPKNVIIEKGKKQFGSTTSSERGEVVTVVYTISASGNTLPPLFIFPRVKLLDHFTNGGPPGCIGRATRSGWINAELFCDYLRHLIRHTRCSTERKILLILDNHESHISLEAIDIAKENGIVMLTIPQHMSHHLQPLGKSVFGPFKTAYKRYMDAWLRSNPGKTITIYDIPSIVTEAQLLGMTPRNILSGFRSTGIFPYNRDVYSEVDFAPAIITDENKRVGKSWWLGFKQRNSLAIRSPEATSLARPTAFNRHTVKEFFDNLACVMDKHKFNPEDIYNLDETGCTTSQNPKNVITEKGKKKVGSTTSSERGEVVTVVYTISASGNTLPPLFIFPRVKLRDHFTNGGPPGCIGRATRSGWINAELFCDYLRHLIRHTRCSTERKILLILDNHESRISLEASDIAKENGIVMLTIPQHTSHRLQPLGKSVFGPFKTAYNRYMDAWLRSNPGKTITIYDIPSTVTDAQLLGMTPRNILSGFRSTGIFPYNRDVYSEVDFAPAILTDRPIRPTETDGLNPTQAINDVTDNTSSAVTGQQVVIPDPAVQVGTLNCNVADDAEDADASSPSEASAHISGSPSVNHDQLVEPHKKSYVSLQEVYSLTRKVTRSRKKRKTKILTSTPVCDEIAQDKETKKQKSAPKVKKALFKNKKTGQQDDSTSSSDEERAITFDDDSDEDMMADDSIIEGDFVVVKVAGKSRIVYFIARIDVLGDEEYEGVFLQKVSGPQSGQGLTFVVNEDDDASIAMSDIVYKLPEPKTAGSSRRLSNRFSFNCDLSKWGFK